jgi:hypothetical protein
MVLLTKDHGAPSPLGWLIVAAAVELFLRLHAVAHGAGSLRAPLSLGSLVIMVSVQPQFAELVFSTNWLSWFSAPIGGWRATNSTREGGSKAQ